MSKIICCYHNKDLDGYTSGAIVRKAFPGCTLIGWDYGLPVPDVGTGNRVIIIDICFPMEDMARIGAVNEVTWIDHHLSQKKEYDALEQKPKLEYVYELGIAACEIGWKYFFSHSPIPKAVELIGKYDTWRGADTPEWEISILPFQYYMRTVCTSPETFPMYFLTEEDEKFDPDAEVHEATNLGRLVIKYQEGQDMLKAERGAFEREVFGGMKALCLNEGVFSSDTLKTRNPERYDVLMGFVYNRNFWRVSLRTLKEDVDVSAIAKARGGGGHKKAAGYEVKTFEEIFK
jgi:oligoribonuclease NrnB/cAMP/cGMP phosphodiesterase (DHH superfamily)